MWTFAAAYIIPREIFSDKWILYPCYLYKAGDEVHNSFDLVSCSAPPPPQTDSCFFVYHARPEDLLQGQRVIVHIMSRTVVSIHTSCTHMVYMGLLNIHAPMKYT